MKAVATIMSAALLCLSEEWLSLLVIAVWAFYAAVRLIDEAGKHGAL